MALPVPLSMAVAIFFTMWWIVLFAVLPFGVRSQEETGTVTPGSEPGAPHAPLLLRKAAWTTAVTAILFVGLMVFMAHGGVGLPPPPD